VLIPIENEKDLADVPESVKAGLEIIAVSTVDEVLALALTGPLIPIEWNAEDEKAVSISDEDDEDEANGSAAAPAPGASRRQPTRRRLADEPERPA